MSRAPAQPAVKPLPYNARCFHNRTRIERLVPYTAVDNECDERSTTVVLVPTYEGGARHFPMVAYWPVFTCASHLPVLLHELTDEDEHGFPREDLILTTITSPEGG